MNPFLAKMNLFLEHHDLTQAFDCLGELLKKMDFNNPENMELLRNILEQAFSSSYAMQLIEYLKQNQFDFSITWPKKGGLAVLFAESNSNDTELFYRLIQYGTDPFLPEANGYTVLHILAQRDKAPGNRKMEALLVELIEGQNDISGWLTPNGYGATIMHLAVLYHHEELLKALLTKGVDPDILGTKTREGYGHVVDFQQVTPLHLACCIGDKTCAALLLEAGARTDITDTHGQIACFYAVQEPSQHYCKQYHLSKEGKKQVLECKAEIVRWLECADISDKDGNTPLLKAVLTHHNNAGGFLPAFFEHDVNINHANDEGITPLIAAVNNRDFQTVKTLVEANAQLNLQDKNGNTALMTAILAGLEEIAQYLVSKGADTTITNKNNQTAKEMAIQKSIVIEVK